MQEEEGYDEEYEGVEEGEEVQMKPETGGVVQRRGVVDFCKKDEDKIPDAPSLDEEVDKKAPKPPTEAPTLSERTGKVPQGKYKTLEEAFKGMKLDKKKMDISEKEPEIKTREKYGTLDEAQKALVKGKEETKEGVGKGLGDYSPEERENFKKMGEHSKEVQIENKQRYSRLGLMKDIQDPNKSTEDVKKSEEQLKLHTRSWSPLKQSYSRQAKVGRLKKLKEQAQMGDEGALKKLKESEKDSSGWDKWLASSGQERGAKVMSGIGSGLKGMFGLGKRFMQTGLDSASEQLFGKAPKKEEKKSAPSGSGSSSGSLMEMVISLRNEVDALKKQQTEE